MFENTFSMISSLDAGLFNWFNHVLQNAFFDAVMPLISKSGDVGLLWIVTGLLLYMFGCIRGCPDVKKTAFLMLAALLASFLLGEEGLKHVFERPRPFETLPGVELLVVPPNSYSFPSGHTANAFAVSLVLARKNPVLAGPVLFLAVLMAFSRVYVGVHYPLDVLSGALVGAVCALLVMKYEAAIFCLTERIKPPYTS